MAVDSLVKAMTHEKVGHTGKGLWGHPTWQLPAYMQHIANDLREKRHKTESEAVHMAIGIVERWKDGGGNVDPETRAAATLAWSEWLALRAKAAALRGAKNLANGDPVDVIDLAAFSADQRKQMAAKGQAMKGGGFPIPDKSHLGKAIHAYGRAKNKVATRAHIKKRAKALGASKMLPSSWQGKPKNSGVMTTSMSAERLQGLVDLANTNPRIRKVVIKKIRSRRIRNAVHPVKLRRINPMPKGKRL